MSHLLTIWRDPQEREWLLDALAAVLCLFALLCALAAGANWPVLAFLFYLVSFLAGMRRPLPDTAHSIAKGEVDVDFLMILVALGAWGLGHPAEGATLLVLFGASRAMESYARRRTHSSIEDLTSELPRQATRVANGEREVVEVDELQPGDEIVVRPGERVPIDSDYLEGRTTLDLSAITGESEPVEPTEGREIPSGAINGNGLARMRVRRAASESAYQKIIQLIENAPARRSPAQVLSDRIGRYFTIAILSISIGGGLMWWLVLGLPFREAGYRAMVLLVAGSPCALVLSIPSAILSAIASGARRGILFNGGLGLSSLPEIKRVAFDKTGTLSTGDPSVADHHGEKKDDEELLALARELGESSTHPASKAIAVYVARINGKANIALEQVVELPGRGVRADWMNLDVELGRPRGCAALEPDHEEHADNAAVALYLDGHCQVKFHLEESLREGARETIEGLRAMGLTTVILSGDRQTTTDRLARQVGIDEVRGDLSPEEKWRAVRDQGRDGAVMMVGDGVNDAPALAEATVGVAMGMRGSAATLAEADIVLVKDQLPDLLEAMEIGYLTRRIIRQNLSLAVGAAAIMVTLALIGILPLALGVFGHEGGTVFVVLNSLRLLARKHPAKGKTSSPRKSTSAPWKPLGEMETS